MVSASYAPFVSSAFVFLIRSELVLASLGGDDLKLKGWDVRTSNANQGRRPTFTHQKR